ncbi:TRAP-type C4-dicarboxylate transport system permease small subunit [Marinobacterium halophilum]|uniref:TRAP transporter small permease protein n=1 Tax=Marinobacterium halophilum TaxID=267374 RepID=A0A2P8ERM9_9GAMM|nr:TRAP transporter small permease [Marinobacterium halophilum]PSL12085.1 TRAP-type C4-dicarboxylate transport system permease small subunit [Marinobacterium halophilum]
MRISLLNLLEFLCAKISILALIVMSGITFMDVFGRVIFNSPLGFSYEVVGICLGICFYSGLYHVHKKRKHVRIDLLEKLFKGKTGIVVTWFGYLVELVFFSALVYMVYQQMEESRQFGDVFMFLGLEKWIVIAVMAVFSVIALISLFVAFPERDQIEAEG